MKCTWGIVVLLAAVVQLSNSHTFHIGDCPKVQPMSGFDIDKFLGKWYVVQKTSSSNKNQVLTYSHGEDVGEYKVVEDAVRPIIGQTEYTGKLRPTDDLARMKVKFQLNPGSYDYIIFMTDYENYAGVFSCQKVLGTNRRAASILSRKPSLEKFYIDKIRDRLSYFNVNPTDLTEIEQDEVKQEDKDRAQAQDKEPLWDLDPRIGQATLPPSNSSELHLFKK